MDRLGGGQLREFWVAGGVLLGLAAVALGRRRDTRTRRAFAGKTVVITGGSRGLGLAMARVFARSGARLTLVARSEEQLAAAATGLRALGARVRTAVCDIRDETAVERTIEGIVRDEGAIDVLVNNAGIIQMMPFVHAQVSDFADSLDTHFWGPLYLIKASLPHMLRQGAGQIVNISSVGGRVALPHFSPYCAGKFALTALSDTLHAELAPLGIPVTTVTPFLMRTGAHRNVIVRGRHRAEATLFALGTASPLTAMSAERAAEAIVAAVARREARVAPGWPVRVAEIAQAVAPELVSALGAAAVRFLLPAVSDSGDGNASRASSDLDLGTTARFFATGSAARLNQRIAPDELRSHRALGATT
jgi:short-subunit dehydrogenase